MGASADDAALAEGVRGAGLPGAAAPIFTAVDVTTRLCRGCRVPQDPKRLTGERLLPPRNFLFGHR